MPGDRWRANRIPEAALVGAHRCQHYCFGTRNSAGNRRITGTPQCAVVAAAFTPDALHRDLALIICAMNAEGVSEQAHAIAGSQRPMD